MPNTTVPAAGEAMPKITRRFILGRMAVMAAPVAVAAALRVEQIDPLLLCQQAAQRLAEAMELVSPGGDWNVIVDHETRCAIVVDKIRAREELA